MPGNVESAASDQRQWGVVVVNWNTAEDAILCLRSILAATGHPGKVVLVDNASTDDSVGRIEAWAIARGVTARVIDEGQEIAAGFEHPWLLLFASRKARGFSANNNLALRYFRDRTDASHVLLLNSDAAVAPEFFTELGRVVDGMPQGGLFTGTIYHDPERDRVWYAGGDIRPLRALATHRVAVPRSLEPAQTSFVSGCAMLIARPVLATVGLLDECFDPAYSEDADYSLRAAAAGFPLTYVPRARVYHQVGRTIGSAALSPSISFAVNRNRALMVRRNHRGWRRAVGLAYMLVTKPGRALLEAAKGRPRTGWAVLAGTLSGVFGKSPRAVTR